MPPKGKRGRGLIKISTQNIIPGKSSTGAAPAGTVGACVTGSASPAEFLPECPSLGQKCQKEGGGDDTTPLKSEVASGIYYSFI